MKDESRDHKNDFQRRYRDIIVGDEDILAFAKSHLRQMKKDYQST